MALQPAFIQPVPLPVPAKTVLRRHHPVCSATRSNSSLFFRKILRHVTLPIVTTATVLAAITNPLNPFIPRPAVAKELRYDGRQELDSKEKAMSLVLTAGTFAALGVWAWKQNRRDDDLEEVRIKDEVERLEKLKAEFLDVEESDDSIDDEDLLASLRERIGEDQDEEGGEGEEGKEEGEGKKTAVKDQEDEASDVDLLKRMWEATEDASDSEKKS